MTNKNAGEQQAGISPSTSSFHASTQPTAHWAQCNQLARTWLKRPRPQAGKQTAGAPYGSAVLSNVIKGCHTKTTVYTHQNHLTKQCAQ